jgi:Cd2+/Zn2+-exporting ATPase
MVTALTGRGVTGQVQGRQITLGSHRYFDTTLPHTHEHCAEARQDAVKGYTPMMISADGSYLGTISVADTLRPDSREALALLRQAQFTNLVMLTGDNADTAAAVGQQVGVTDVRADLLPEDKVAAVNALREQYGAVAMVGDGINDAPALATATVGIAVGGASGGTAQAMETADITLMSDDLRRLPFVFQLSRATMRTIQVNVALSIGIKLAFVLLVLFGLGTMWMAVLADMGTSLLVSLNGMRLLGRGAGFRSQVSGYRYQPATHVSER